MIKKLALVPFIFVSLIVSPVLADEDGPGARIENYFDKKGDRINHRLDRKGDRINHRLDRKGHRIHKRVDRRINHQQARRANHQRGSRR